MAVLMVMAPVIVWKGQHFTTDIPNDRPSSQKDQYK